MLTALYLVYNVLSESLLQLCGLKNGTRSRSLYDKGQEYIMKDLAEIAVNQGYATVKVPFNYLPEFIVGPVKYLTIITDTDLAKKIGSYGVTVSNFDEKARVPFHMIDILMRSSNIVSRNDTNVPRDRCYIKNVLHNQEYVNSVIHNEFKEWIKTYNGKTIDLQKTLTKTLVKILGKSLLGMHNFPPDNNKSKNNNESEDFTIDNMISMLEDIDEAMSHMDIDKIKHLEPLIKNKYSDWMYDNNRDTLSSENSVIPYLLGDINKNINIVNAFLITPNITKLVYMSVIFFSIHLDWQEKLRKALECNDKEQLNYIYMELARLYIPTNIPRYASKSTTFKTKNGNIEFPPGTLFYILGRKIRMNPDIYPNPTTFNPDRFRDSNIRMNQIEMCPFGIGPRQCPASGQFTFRFWKSVMENIFLQIRIECEEEIEEIPIDARHIKLKKVYKGKVMS